MYTHVDWDRSLAELDPFSCSVVRVGVVREKTRSSTIIVRAPSQSKGGEVTASQQEKIRWYTSTITHLPGCKLGPSARLKQVHRRE